MIFTNCYKKESFSSKLNTKCFSPLCNCALRFARYCCQFTFRTRILCVQDTVLWWIMNAYLSFRVCVFDFFFPFKYLLLNDLEKSVEMSAIIFVLHVGEPLECKSSFIPLLHPSCWPLECLGANWGNFSPSQPQWVYMVCSFASLSFHTVAKWCSGTSWQPREQEYQDQRQNYLCSVTE